MESSNSQRTALRNVAGWVMASTLVVGLAGCGAAHPEPVAGGETVNVPLEESEQNQGTTQENATTGDLQQGLQSSDLDGARRALEIDLAAFANGDVDEIDTPAIDQLDDQDLLTPAVVAAWVSGFDYTVGDATSTGASTCTVDVSITCRKIGPAYNSASITANELADGISRIEPETSDIQVDMRLDDDGEWEPTASGYEALNGALVGTLAR